jgi:hypothetical protein
LITLSGELDTAILSGDINFEGNNPWISLRGKGFKQTVFQACGGNADVVISFAIPSPACDRVTAIIASGNHGIDKLGPGAGLPGW